MNTLRTPDIHELKCRTGKWRRAARVVVSVAIAVLASTLGLARANADSLDKERTTYPVRVMAAVERESPVRVNLAFERGRVVTTPEHPFFVADRGWVKAGALTEGDRVVTKDGVTVVRNVMTENSPVHVFNFRLARLHTYFVGPEQALVHNAVSCMANLANNAPGAGRGALVARPAVPRPFGPGLARPQVRAPRLSSPSDLARMERERPAGSIAATPWWSPFRPKPLEDPVNLGLVQGNCAICTLAALKDMNEYQFTNAYKVYNFEGQHEYEIAELMKTSGLSSDGAYVTLKPKDGKSLSQQIEETFANPEYTDVNAFGMAYGGRGGGHIFTALRDPKGKVNLVDFQHNPPTQYSGFGDAKDVDAVWIFPSNANPAVNSKLSAGLKGAVLEEPATSQSTLFAIRVLSRQPNFFDRVPSAPRPTIIPNLPRAPMHPAVLGTPLTAEETAAASSWAHYQARENMAFIQMHNLEDVPKQEAMRARSDFPNNLRDGVVDVYPHQQKASKGLESLYSKLPKTPGIAYMEVDDAKITQVREYLASVGRENEVPPTTMAALLNRPSTRGAEWMARNPDNALRRPIGSVQASTDRDSQNFRVLFAIEHKSGANFDGFSTGSATAENTRHGGLVMIPRDTHLALQGVSKFEHQAAPATMNPGKALENRLTNHERTTLVVHLKEM